MSTQDGHTEVTAIPPSQAGAAPAPAARATAWPATLLALVALGVAGAAAGYVWLQEQRGGASQGLKALEAEVQSRNSELAALAARVDEMAAARRRLDSDLDRLADRMDRDTESLAALPARVAQIEESVQRFLGASDRIRAAWLLSEAEHYMRIANAQLGLAGDVGVAQTALTLADETLRELGDPKLRPVRQLLAQELAALKAVPRPDTEGIVLSLGTLAESLEGLPLKQRAPGEFRALAPEPGAELTGFDRALAAARNALLSLVSVRRSDAPISPLLTEAEQSLLVRSLDLELQLARLAIMRGDTGMFRRSLEAATTRVRLNFDLASPSVQAVLGTLQELGTAELPEEIPDISGSLAALLEATGSRPAP
jgi:uroporphyrin-3 C-methyltransferase